MAELTRIPHLSLNWSPAGDVIITQAQGCEMFDTNGKRYLDFLSGIGVVNTGHCHPKVVEAIVAQAQSLIHSQSYLALHPAIIKLGRLLTEITPGEIDSFFFCSSGSEAVEAGMRLARAATGRNNIIAFQGGFHGRTAGAMSLTTSNASYRSGALPFMPGVFFAPFPRVFRHQLTEAEATERCLQALRELLLTQSRPEHTAAMVIEPVQGEGGIVSAPDAFMQGLRELCNTHGIMLIADEIQAGFGRTGRMFAVEHSGVTPDIILLGKGIASGLPFAGIGAPETIMDKAPSGSQGGTYNGNALGSAAAVASIEVLLEENLPQQSADKGEYFRDKLREITSQFGANQMDVRGRGLMIAIEMMKADGTPATAEANTIMARCREHGVIMLNCGPESNVVRMTPPLVVTHAEIDEVVDIFAAALDAAFSG